MASIYLSDVVWQLEQYNFNQYGLVPTCYLLVGEFLLVVGNNYAPFPFSRVFWGFVYRTHALLGTLLDAPFLLAVRRYMWEPGRGQVSTSPSFFLALV